MNDISAHQEPATSVVFVNEWQAIVGDWVRNYRAPDGEVVEVCVRKGAYAPDEPRLTEEQAVQQAIDELNARRARRAERVSLGLPVTVQLKGTAEE
jgi:hypothetical protein